MDRFRDIPARPDAPETPDTSMHLRLRKRDPLRRWTAVFDGPVETAKPARLGERDFGESADLELTVRDVPDAGGVPVSVGGVLVASSRTGRPRHPSRSPPSIRPTAKSTPAAADCCATGSARPT